MQSIHSRIQFLVQVAHIPPEALDFFFPHGPVLKSVASREYIMSTVVRDISFQIADKDLAGKVKAAGAEMAKQAFAGLVNSWEDDDLCPLYPPYPWPHWFGNGGPVSGPQPEPWFASFATELNPQPLPPKLLAAGLKVIAKYSSLPDLSKQLGDLAARLGQIRG